MEHCNGNKGSFLNLAGLNFLIHPYRLGHLGHIGPCLFIEHGYA